MTSKLFLTSIAFAALLGCESRDQSVDRRVEVDRKVDKVNEEAVEAKAALSRRLDQLDAEVDRLQEKAKTASARSKAKLNQQAEEAKLEAKRLRARMSTWDDKAADAWRVTKREVEEGLDKTESTLKKIWNDIKD